MYLITIILKKHDSTHYVEENEMKTLLIIS